MSEAQQTRMKPRIDSCFASSTTGFAAGMC
jgi:hypothetical protein